MIIGTLEEINKKLECKNPELKYKIKQYRATRSNQANRYLHACFSFLGDELGYETEEMKSIIKYKFLSVERPHGTVVKNTRDLDTKELANFINQFRRWASVEIGIYVPSPDDKRIDDFYSQYLK